MNHGHKRRRKVSRQRNRKHSHSSTRSYKGMNRYEQNIPFPYHTIDTKNNDIVLKTVRNKCMITCKEKYIRITKFLNRNLKSMKGME
jgi:hypothetical protein